VIKRATTPHASQPIRDHDQAIGGILIGKRLANNRIAIVAATEPGAHPNNRQLGFALDPGHANAVLEQWFARDPDVDFIGVWHTHPPDRDQPDRGDMEVARKLFDDPGYATVELVNPIVVMERGAPIIRCFYLSREAARAGKEFTAVPYEEADDDASIFLERSVAGVGAAAGEDELGPDRAVEVAIPASVSRGEAGHASAREVRAPARAPQRPFVFAGVAGLLLIGGMLFTLAGRGRPDQEARGVLPAEVSTAGGHVAAAGPQTTALEDQTALGALVPTEDLATPTVRETASPTPSPTSPAPTATPSPTPALEPKGAAESTTIEPSQTSPPQQATAAGLPYTLRFEPMQPAARRAFLQRTRQLRCEGCYNVNIVGPTPYVDLRIQVDGTRRRTWRNYEVASPAQLPPRAKPYVLQAFDPEGRPLSKPISLTVEKGTYYVLRIDGARP
jgi:hypothetical protein